MAATGSIINIVGKDKLLGSQLEAYFYVKEEVVMDISKVGAQTGQQVYWSLIRALKNFPYARQVAALKAVYPDITQSEIEHYIGVEPKPARQYLPEGYVVVDIDEDFSWEKAIAAGILTKADSKRAYGMGVNFEAVGRQCNLEHLNEDADPALVRAIQEYALATGKAKIAARDEVSDEYYDAKGVYNIVMQENRSEQA